MVFASLWAGTRIVIDSHWAYPDKATFTVIDGPAAGYRGECFVWSLEPLSALEILAEQADDE